MNWQKNHNILVQGIHTPLAQYYVPWMLAYGTQIIGGVSAGAAREENEQDTVPVFDLVAAAVEAVGEITTSLIFVDALDVLDAALEAIAADIKQLIIVSADVPPLDMVSLLCQAEKQGVEVLGPGSKGLIVPGKLWLGTGFVEHFQPGPVAILSRFSSLSQETAILLNQKDLGQSCVIDVGNADLPGSTFAQWLTLLDADPDTKAIALLGRYGAQEEIELLPFIRDQIQTPVVTYLSGSHAPIQRRCHGGAETIITSQLSYCLSETYTPDEMAATFKREKLKFARSLTDLPRLLKQAITPRRSRAKTQTQHSATS